MKTKIFEFYLLCADENLNTLICNKCNLENDLSVIKYWDKKIQLVDLELIISLPVPRLWQNSQIRSRN